MRSGIHAIRNISSPGFVVGLISRYPLTPTIPPCSTALAAQRVATAAALRPALHFLHPASPKSPIATTPLRPSTNTTTIASFFSRLTRSIFGLATAAAPKAEMSAPESPKARVQRIIDENAVVIFSKSYCPACRASKKLLHKYKAEFFTLELDELADGGAIQAALLELNGQSTVPNIYISGQHIGGNSDLQARKDLGKLLSDAGAI